MTPDENPLLSIVGPGRIVSGKYRIGNMLGSGASSIVVEAHNIQNGQRYALKLLDAERVQRLGGPEVLLKAARAIAELRSEHTIRLLAVGALDNGAPYLLMEYLAGADFGRVLADRGPLRVPEAADAIMQACDSLAEAHARGLVHGALKPQNLFIANETDGRRILKVGDFGGFGALDPAHSGERHAHSFEYASPEQLLSQKVDARSDVWALGVILFELVSGARPFDAKHLDELVATRATAPPPQLRSRFGPVPDAFEAAIRRCLAFDPGFRFQSAAEVARAIAPFASTDLRELVPRIERASDRAMRNEAVTQLAMSSSNENPAAAHQHFSVAAEAEAETATTPMGRSSEHGVARRAPPPPTPVAAQAPAQERISWSDIPTVESSAMGIAGREQGLQRQAPSRSRSQAPPQQPPQQLVAVVQSSSRATNIALAIIALLLLLALPLLYLHSLAKKTEFAAPTNSGPTAEPTYTIEGPSAIPPQAPPRIPPKPPHVNPPPTNHR